MKKIVYVVFVILCNKYILFSQSQITSKVFHDNANRIIEIQKAVCSYTTYSYDRDGNRSQKLIKVIQPAIEVNNTSCGLNNGSIEAFTPPGENFSYKWSTGSTQAKIINLAPGKYQLTIKDLNNSNNYECSKEFEILASSNPILEAKITPLGSVSFCEGDTLKLKASYQLFNEYNWYRNGILVQNGIDSIYKATLGGTYWVEILNSGCSKVSPTIVLTTLSKPSPIVVPARNPIICQNDTITLSSSISGMSYKWNTNQTTKSIIVSLAGKYKLTLTDANGCTGVSPELEVKVNPLPQFSLNSSKSPPVFCDRDSSLLSPSINGIKYQWNTNQNSKSIFVKSSGKYILTLTDNNQCSNTNSIDVIVNPLPKVKANASVNVVCHGENVTLFGTGASSYIWDKGALNNIPFKPNNSLRYFVVGTDLNGCQDTASIQITVNELPITNITSSNIKCYGINDGEIHVTAQNGLAPYQYSINNLNYQTSPDFLNLSIGTYSVSARDNRGCISQIIPIQIFQFVTQVSSNISKVDIKCSGSSTGQFTIQTTGGTPPYFYSVNNGTFSQNNSYSNLKAGTYEVIIKDNNGCTSNKSIVINQPPVLEIPTITTLFVKCFGGNDGSILVEGQGGTPPYRYSINGGSLTSNNNFKNLVAGQYSIRVMDFNGCIVDYSTIVNEPSKLNANIISQTSDDCFPIGTGSFNVGATGGIGNKLFSLDNGFNFQSSGIFNNLIAGTFNLIIKDDNNCQINLPITILKTSPINDLKIIVQNDTLISPYSDSSKWYEIGNPNIIGTGKEYICTHDANYYVIGLDINGCEARSEVLVHNCITSTDDSRNKLEVIIYPNPASNYFNIEFLNAESGVYLLTINGEDGKAILTNKLNINNSNFNYKLNANNLLPGNYFLKIENVKFIYRGALVKY